MNTRKSKTKLKNLQILLESGCSSTILMGKPFETIRLKRYSVIQWNTHTENVTTNFKVKIDFTFFALSVTNVITWDCHVDDSAK